MTKSELIEEITRRVPRLSKRDVEMVVCTIFESMSDALSQKNRIEIRGFGSFVAKARKAREGRNPRTGETVQVPDKYVPFFTAGKELRERVNHEWQGSDGSSSLSDTFDISPPDSGDSELL
jgi:integration host factor subunit beta